MKVLHPFMPFVTEEVYHLVKERNADDFITIASYPAPGKIDLAVLSDGERIKELVAVIRDLRNKNQVKPKEQLSLYSFSSIGEENAALIRKLGGLTVIERISADPEHALPFIVGTDKYFLQLPNTINLSEEKSRLEKDIEYQRGFLESVMKKLGNDKFISKASADIIDKEKKESRGCP
jgi:valyl-tRNA synthetase